MLSLANVVGAVIALAMIRCFTIRTLLIAGQFIMAFFLGCVVFFSYLGIPLMSLVSMVLMILTF